MAQRRQRLPEDAPVLQERIVVRGGGAVVESGESGAPAVAFDREGDAVLAWANDNVVQARTLSASGTLGGLKTVSADLSPIDRDGDALVTWVHWTAADRGEQGWGRWGSPDGTGCGVRQLTPLSHPDV